MFFIQLCQSGERQNKPFIYTQKRVDRRSLIFLYLYQMY